MRRAFEFDLRSTPVKDDHPFQQNVLIDERSLEPLWKLLRKARKGVRANDRYKAALPIVAEIYESHPPIWQGTNPADPPAHRDSCARARNQPFAVRRHQDVLRAIVFARKPPGPAFARPGFSLSPSEIRRDLFAASTLGMIAHCALTVPDDGEPLGHKQGSKVFAVSCLHKGAKSRVVPAGIHALPACEDRKGLAQLVLREVFGEIGCAQRGTFGGLQAEILALLPPAGAGEGILFHTIHKIQAEYILLAAPMNLNTVAITARTFEEFATVESLPASGQQRGLGHENGPCHQRTNSGHLRRTGRSTPARPPPEKSRRHLLRVAP